jgi:invasion protein IalB
MRTIWKAGAIALLATVLDGHRPAHAQVQQSVAIEQDWSVFQATPNGQKVCWIASQPTKTAAVRDGKAVQVRRGDVFLMVSVRPGDGVRNEVSFIAGYPFKKGSEVAAKVGDKSFTMFTEGENAWAPSAADDDAIVNAFRAGADAKVEGVSSRGTKTVDTFSLMGFSAALEKAAGLCK